MEINKNTAVYFLTAIALLLPVASCVEFSVTTDAGYFTENLGAGIDDALYGSTTITREALDNAAWGVSGPVDSKSSSRKSLSLKEVHGVSNQGGAHAEVGVDIRKARSYKYAYQLSPGDEIVQAAEALDVTNADYINAYAKAYNAKGHDVSVNTQVLFGNLLGYQNLAIASNDAVGALEMFDTATGVIQCDSTSRQLSSPYSDSLEKSTRPEASISTLAVGTVSEFEGAAAKSIESTSLEQNAGIKGIFASTSNAGGLSKSRASNYGSKFDLNMQAGIEAGELSVKGTMVYYIDPKLKVQKAVDASQSGDVISLSSGTYNQNVKINKPVTVRGQGILGTITNAGAVVNNGGENYINAKQVLIRADDFYSWNSGWQWLTGLTNSKSFSATYAVIPAWLDWDPDDNNNAAQLRQNMDKSKIEIATHGLQHENFVPSSGSLSYLEQYGLINQATGILTTKFTIPRTFVSPFGANDENTLEACKALGYHTISGDYVEGVEGITQQTPDIFWEKSDGSGHYSLDEFKSAWYAISSGSGPITILLHPNTYLDASGNLKAEDAKNFEDSIDFLKEENVEFLTMDHYYKWNSQ